MVGQPVANESSERSRFLSSAVALIFGLDSDYQQDKATPNWGKSAQPGPTYFFSKETNYIHIMNAHACGDTDGPSRLSRNFLYIRSQQCAGSKDCNDTVFTMFNVLAAPLNYSCVQPLIFRTGYDEDGPIMATPGTTGTAAEDRAPRPAATDAAPTGVAEEPALSPKLTAETLARCVEATPAWRSWMEAGVHVASQEVLRAHRQVGQAHLLTSPASPPITMQDVLAATRPNAEAAKAAKAAKAADTDVDALLEATPTAALVNAALAYLFASRPQLFVRRVSQQMDRCSGTNLSQYTFGGISLGLATDVVDVWDINTMIPGHTKFGPDFTALKLANKLPSPPSRMHPSLP